MSYNVYDGLLSPELAEIIDPEARWLAVLDDCALGGLGGLRLPGEWVIAELARPSEPAKRRPRMGALPAEWRFQAYYGNYQERSNRFQGFCPLPGVWLPMDYAPKDGLHILVLHEAGPWGTLEMHWCDGWMADAADDYRHDAAAVGWRPIVTVSRKE